MHALFTFVGEPFSSLLYIGPNYLPEYVFLEKFSSFSYIVYTCMFVFMCVLLM